MIPDRTLQSGSEIVTVQEEGLYSLSIRANEVLKVWQESNADKSIVSSSIGGLIQKGDGSFRVV